MVTVYNSLGPARCAARVGEPGRSLRIEFDLRRGFLRRREQLLPLAILAVRIASDYTFEARDLQPEILELRCHLGAAYRQRHARIFENEALLG